MQIINDDGSMGKNRQLDQYRVCNNDEKLTTNLGVKLSNTDDSLKAGERGPTLLEDFHFREKITHFDHERIPERVVHARGFGAHGVFELYESMAEYTTASFLQDTAVKTPVFVRFSTVAGSRGSADTARDVRGFAVKFYTQTGNYDIVGNNIPVFFIQDAIKFPDLIHAVKPEPNNEIPQATTAHDTFWDFVVNTPETAHMVMWIVSDRALPRSFRMMEGFGVNTFRFVNTQGKARFVKFHWKPLLGVHSLLRDEAQKLSGKDPDFHRRDLWDAIEQGNYPEYEFGVQMIEEENEFAFDFDILDATKLWPEELIPVKRIGKLTLNRNVDNFFAETEQVAFCPANLIPGIDFSNDPLLQGRLFSYEDTQLTRLGGPNFKEIPINRPVACVHNNQRDGMHRMAIHKGPVSYSPNSLANGFPAAAPECESFMHYAERVDAHVIRGRSESFRDYFSQATLFWNSMSQVEKEHIVDGFHFESGSVKDKSIKQRVADMFAVVAPELGEMIAARIGVNTPLNAQNSIHLPAETDKQAANPAAKPAGKKGVSSSPALSQLNTVQSAKTRKIAILAENGFCGKSLQAMLDACKYAGVTAEVISSTLTRLSGLEKASYAPDKDFTTATPLLYDAVYIPGGSQSADALKICVEARNFINEALLHCKTVGASDEGLDVLSMTDAARLLPLDKAGNTPQAVQGVAVVKGAEDMKSYCETFIGQVAMHRHWERANQLKQMQ